MVDVVLAEKLAESLGDMDWFDEAMFGDVGVGIVLSHADEIDVIWCVIAAIEIGEVPIGKSLGDFDGTIGAKIEINE